MSGDLAAFITARLDEDEATVRDAVATEPQPWQEWPEAHQPLAVVERPFDVGLGAAGPLDLLDHVQHPWEWEDQPEAYVAHFGRHGPPRVLREVAAWRALLKTADDAYYAADHYAHDQILAALAGIWSDHPDYRPEWAPP